MVRVPAIPDERDAVALAKRNVAGTASAGVVKPKPLAIIGGDPAVSAPAWAARNSSGADYRPMQRA
jgi:hypothetical protein